MERRRDPVTRLSANLMQVESWARKGKTEKARDMLQGCIALYLPAVPEEVREPWERKIRELDERLPGTQWSPRTSGGGARPSPPRNPSEGEESPEKVAPSSLASRSPVWERLSRALDDRRTDFVVLSVDSFRARFDFVSTESGVQVWVTIQNATERAWKAAAGSQFIRAAHAVAPGTHQFEPTAVAPSGVGWQLVWVFTSILDARVEVKDEFLASAPDLAPELTVQRYPLSADAEFDREVERLGRRSYRPGHGHKRFAVTTCAKCGQPLSDPQSVVLGIGPDCLKYFDPNVLAAAKKWKPGSVRASGRTPRQFFSGIAAPW